MGGGNAPSQRYNGVAMTKSSEYMEGYQAYMSWYHNQTQRPINPYQFEADAGDAKAFDDWQNGWDDASFDV